MNVDFACEIFIDFNLNWKLLGCYIVKANRIFGSPGVGGKESAIPWKLLKPVQSFFRIL